MLVKQVSLSLGPSQTVVEQAEMPQGHRPRHPFRVLLLCSALLASPLVSSQEIRTYYITDSEGSSVAATAANGRTVWTEDYLPYGERRVNAAAAQSNQRWFTSALQNRDTGLLYLGHRYMDPVQGRFVSMDPSDVSLKDGANFNRYWYADDNPYAYLDPNGGNVFSVLDWYDFGRANGRLLVNEGVWVTATVLGNEGAAQVAQEEMEAGVHNAILSTVGVVSILPGTGRILKAADRIEEGSEALQLGATGARSAAEIVASNGTKIAGFTRHGIHRAIRDAASRAGTRPQAILDALKNPTKIVEGIDKEGRPFQIFTGENARVVVNPETRQIVSTNPLSALGAQ